MPSTVTGKIYRIVPAKGFAFIRTEDRQDWFLHRSELRNADFTDLAEGQEVEFVPVQAIKGPRATDCYVR